MLKGEVHSYPVDWWSLGTLMYEMMTGLPPFYSEVLSGTPSPSLSHFHSCSLLSPYLRVNLHEVVRTLDCDGPSTHFDAKSDIDIVHLEMYQNIVAGDLVFPSDMSDEVHFPHSLSPLPQLEP